MVNIRKQLYKCHISILRQSSGFPHLDVPMD
jgi:hypothetical protein